MKKTFLALISASILSADLLISPTASMQDAFSPEIEVQKKNILLSREQTHSIEQEIKGKLKTKLYQIYKASKNDKLLGYGILISQNVRSKNCVAMYHISNDSILKSIEIIAFNEPKKYLPSKNWIQVFNGASTSQPLYLSKEIPNISGATLSAKAVTDASRIAFAIYNQILKGKK